jgi:hypothetical protein
MILRLPLPVVKGKNLSRKSRFNIRITDFALIHPLHGMEREPDIDHSLKVRGHDARTTQQKSEGT